MSLRGPNALVRSTARLLRLRALGRAADQLPAPAPDAREPDRRDPAAPDPRPAGGEPRDREDLRGARRRWRQLDLAGLRDVSGSHRAPRLRRLDVALPGAGVDGR